MTWKQRKAEQLFSNDIFAFAPFSPYAVIDISDEEICIDGAAEYQGESVLSTDFGEGICHKFINTHKQVSLLSEICVGDTFVYFKQTLENHSPLPVYWHTAGYRTCAKILKGEPKDYTLYSLHINDVESRLGEREDFRAPFFSKETLLLYRDQGKRGFTIAPVGEAEAFLNCSYKTEENTISFTVESDMCSVRVDPNERRQAQDFVMLHKDAGSAIRQIIENYAKHLGTRVCGEAPYGWCSWYYRFFNVEEKDVFGVIDYYAARPQLPRPTYVQIDEGWERHWGDWQENDKFPAGIEEFVKRTKGIGSAPGLWVVPTWIKEDLPLFSQHPDWFARKKDGSLAVYHNWLDGTCWGIDITHPKARAFALSILRSLYEKGVRYFKLDSNIFYTNGHTSFNPKMTELQAVRALYSAYREALPKAHINACTMFLNRGVIGYADSCRLAADVDRDWNTREDKITAYCQMSSCAIKAYANGVLFYNDPDVLYFMGEERLAEMQRRLWLAFVTLSGGTVGHSEIASTLSAYPDEQALVWPPSIERGLPVYPCTLNEGQRFGFIARRDFGDFGVFLLWNAEHGPFNTALSPILSKLGERFHVFSFWDRQYLGIHTADTILNLQHHEGGVYRFTPIAEMQSPVLIGSTLHLSMGANEIENITNDGHTLSIALGLDGATSGALYFYSEAQIQSVDASNCTANIVALSDCLWEVKINNRSAQACISLCYGK